MRQVYQVVRLASVTIQAFTRGWMARKRYKKVCNCSLINESLNNKKIVNVTTRFILHCVCVNPQMMKEQKALVLQKYARAWMARRRFQTMRRLVLNVQLSYRVQQLRKKIEEQVTMLPNVLQLWLWHRRLNWIPASSQNKENRGLMERLTSVANSHSQSMDRLQVLEAQLEKVNNQKESLEAREKKAKGDASLVGLEVDAEVDAWVVCVLLFKKKRFYSLSRQLQSSKRKQMH